MTKDEVVNKVKSLNFPKNSYVVFGSGPLAAVGIREVNDIDLYVSGELLQQLGRKGWKKIYKGPKDNPLTFDVFEAHDNWEFSHYHPSLSELQSRSFEVDGVIFAAIEDVQKWKKDMTRSKDLEDKKLINAFLQKSFSK